MTTDWRTLLAAYSMDASGSLDAADWEYFLAEAMGLLDLPVCKACEGRNEDDDGNPCTHQNAPTIGRLLAIGEAVLKWRHVGRVDPYNDFEWVRFDYGEDGYESTCDAHVLLAALKAVGE